MTDQDKARINREIAEALGWTACTNSEEMAFDPDGMLCHGYPDFFTDESANAMLLDRMPSASLQHWSDGWRCTSMIQHFGGESVVGYSSDRRTAVVLAFLAFITKEKPNDSM